MGFFSDSSSVCGRSYAFTYVFVCECVHVCLGGCMLIYVQVHVHRYMCLFMFVRCMFVHEYVGGQVHVFVCFPSFLPVKEPATHQKC